MFKWTSRNVDFYKKADEAIFMLQNLNDDDIADGRARFALLRLGKTELDIFSNLYFCWCSIAVTAKVLIDRGYELSPDWESRLVSASDHLILGLYPLMSARNQDIFNNNVQVIFGNAMRLNPSIGLPAYVEPMKIEEV